MTIKIPLLDPHTVPTRRVGPLLSLRNRVRKNQTELAQYTQALSDAQNELVLRAQKRFNPKYPDLPVSERAEEIRELIRANPIVIIEGDTGSGKTTQIPKICLELGLSDRGLVACTQPRRIAATSIAARLREELEDPESVGYKIRFREDCPPEMRLLVMTDGVLLQEYRNDPFLSKYSCIILDEAHERSLNMDLLLGIFKNLREQRPDLKIIVTSATLDTNLFAKFFENAPILSVAGRAFPVQIRYQEENDESQLDERAADAILELMSERPDHLLCFLPTERDILETQALLEPYASEMEILPLYARLSQGDQARIFAPSSKPKVILSTNVAETSLTIPGIAYVVDSGLARVSRYQAQNRVQGLPVEKISQASARQRSGRAGRVKPGVCLRLYAESDFLDRPAYTDPEILRSSLDNVVLQLRHLRLDPEKFPFVQAPSHSALRQACLHLWEIGALADSGLNGELTPVGRKMAQLPMDAVLARILLHAETQNLFEAVAVVCAALSLPEFRHTPQDPTEKQAAENARRPWTF
jgi:RNA helicase HrpA